MVAAIAATALAQSTETRAAALEKQANGWLDVPGKWPSVARALERAAEIRGAEDPQAIRDLVFSANVRLQVGDQQRAQQQFVQAAEWALALGDIETAAQGFVRGAAVAAHLKDVATARLLCERAEKLSRSPLLTTAKREAILSQFSGI